MLKHTCRAQTSHADGIPTMGQRARTHHATVISTSSASVPIAQCMLEHMAMNTVTQVSPRSDRQRLTKVNPSASPPVPPIAPHRKESSAQFTE